MLLLYLAVMAAFFMLGQGSSVVLTQRKFEHTCPEVGLICSVVDLQSSRLNLFLNHGSVAEYLFAIDSRFSTSSPYQHIITSAQMVAASSISSTFNFLSTITVNISAMLRENITTIGCGDLPIVSSIKFDANKVREMPQSPKGVVVVMDYDPESQSIHALVQWNQVISLNEYCNHTINYTVFLENSEEMVVARIDATSANCENHVCSVSLSPLPSDLVHSVVVSAHNVFGSSLPSNRQYLYSSIEQLFSYLLSYNDCVTKAVCSTTLSEMGNCTIQYSRDPSYQIKESSIIISSSLNSSFDLPLMDSSTLYYLKITFVLDSEEFFVTRTFTTGKGAASFTTANLVLFVVGVVVFSTAVALLVLLLVLEIKNRRDVSVLVRLVIGGFLTVISAILWIATAVYVSQKTKTCDPVWQTTRSGLIISAHAFSDIAFLVLLLALNAVYATTSDCRCNKEPSQDEDQNEAEVAADHNTNTDPSVEKSIEMKQNATYGISSQLQYENPLDAMNSK